MLLRRPAKPPLAGSFARARAVALTPTPPLSLTVFYFYPCVNVAPPCPEASGRAPLDHKYKTRLFSRRSLVFFCLFFAFHDVWFMLLRFSPHVPFSHTGSSAIECAR
jgi:hypothetical protein